MAAVALQNYVLLDTLDS